MKIIYKCISLFIISLSYNNSNLQAQEKITYSSENSSSKLFNGTKDYRTWSIGINTGALLPVSAFGGRNDFTKYEANLGYGVYVKNQISHSLALQADYLGGIISANNDNLLNGLPPNSPYKSFKTNLNWSASLSLVATLGNINWSQLNTIIMPYASIGLGGIDFSPSLVKKDGSNFDYTSNESFSKFVPVGFGFKTNLTESINLDLGYKIAFYDGDDIDGYFKDPIVNDRFSYAHIGLEFSLGNKNKPQLARHNAPRQLSKEMNDKDLALRKDILALMDMLDIHTKDYKSLKDELSKIKKDTDGDGISDYFDKCAATLSGTKVDGSGCPLPEYMTKLPIIEEKVKVVKEITQEDINVINEASKNLFFESGNAILKPSSLQYLHRVADILIKKELNIKLEGHTDNIGAASANLKLSKARVEAVKQFLLKQGITKDHITAIGYGETRPKASNATAAGRLMNRRVEFTIY